MICKLWSCLQNKDLYIIIVVSALFNNFTYIKTPPKLYIYVLYLYSTHLYLYLYIISTYIHAIHITPSSSPGDILWWREVEADQAGHLGLMSIPPCNYCFIGTNQKGYLHHWIPLPTHSPYDHYLVFTGEEGYWNHRGLRVRALGGVLKQWQVKMLHSSSMCTSEGSLAGSGNKELWRHTCFRNPPAIHSHKSSFHWWPTGTLLRTIYWIFHPDLVFRIRFTSPVTSQVMTSVDPAHRRWGRIICRDSR